MITDEEMAKILDAWREAFWNYREDVGIGDSFKVESGRLEKNLAKLKDDLTSGHSTTPGQVRSFLKDYSVMTKELEELLTRIEKNIGERSKIFDYSEYLEY